MCAVASLGCREELTRRLRLVTSRRRIKKDEKRDEKNRIHISFKRKDSKRLYITKDKKCKKEEKESAAAGIGDKVPQDDGRAEAARSDDIDALRKGGEGKCSSSITSPQNRSEEP